MVQQFITTHMGNMVYVHYVYYTHPCQIRGKHEVIHYELSDLFPQLAQTWQTWGSNAYNDEMPRKPLHWRHNERDGVSNHQFLHFFSTVVHQSSVSLAFAWGIHRWPVSSPHKRSVTRKMLPFDDVIVISCIWPSEWNHSIYQIHYTGVTWALWRLESLATLLVVQQLLRVTI